MGVVDPAAQKWARRRTPFALTAVTVHLNPSVVAALDRFVSEDTGVGRAMDRELAAAWLIADGLGLHKPVPFAPLTTEKGPR